MIYSLITGKWKSVGRMFGLCVEAGLLSNPEADCGEWREALGSNGQTVKRWRVTRAISQAIIPLINAPGAFPSEDRRSCLSVYCCPSLREPPRTGWWRRTAKSSSRYETVSCLVTPSLSRLYLQDTILTVLSRHFLIWLLLTNTALYSCQTDARVDVQTAVVCCLYCQRTNVSVVLQ